MKLTLRFGLSDSARSGNLSLRFPRFAQDWVHTGSNLGNARIRLAAADFKPVGADPQTPALKATFDSTLFNDLQNAGIFDMVSKSFSSAGHARLAAGDQSRAVVRRPRQRRNGRLRRALRRQRPPHRLRLAR